MATRRNVPGEKTVLEQQGGAPTASMLSSDTAPAVSASVIYKLLFFTFAMVVFPIGTYFLTVHSIFRGNATYAGALAAVMANVVLIGYIVVAMQEDQSDRLEAEKARKGKAE